jgi:hypothetical protein
MYNDWTLRSGGAQGADTAFERGAGGKADIFLANDATLEAAKIAREYHPAWDRCTSYAKRLHARNAFQVLGGDLKTPSKFLLCWTPDGCEKHADRTIKTGGTGTAISIASENGIKVYNLYHLHNVERIKRYLEKR